MMKGEALFIKMSGNLQNGQKYWDTIMDREGLVDVLKETPDLTLESYRKFTIDPPKPEVFFCLNIIL